MTTIANATVDELSYHDSELAYIALTLFITALSALLASFFRPHRRHDTASPSSVHGTGCGSHELRQDPVCV